MSDYQAYLLRLQRHAERAHWGATLENVETGEVLRFRSVPELLAYVSEITSSAQPSIQKKAELQSKGVDHV